MIIQTTLSVTSGSPDPQGTSVPDGIKTGAAATATGTAQGSATPTRQQLENAINEANRSLQPANRSLQFSLDRQSDRVVVKIVDSETGETLRQIPSEQVLAIAESIDHYQKGLLLNQKA